MPDSIPEQIAQVIETRLQSITKANDYNQNATVQRMKGKTVSPQNNLILLESGGDSPAGEDDGPVVFPGNPPAVQRKRTYTIWGFVVIDEKSNECVDALLDNLMADIQKAVTDATDWHRFGGLSVLADFGEITREVIEGFPVIHVPLDVTYRHSENDPYTVR